MLGTDEISRLLIDASPCAYLVCDQKQQIVFTNPGFGTLFQIQLNSIDHEKPQIPANLSWLFDSGSTHEWESPSGLKWIRVLQRPLEQGYLLFTYLDVSELYLVQRENEQLRQELQERLGTDHLTGLLNQRALVQILEPQIARSRRYHNPLSVVMMGIYPFLFDATETAELDDEQLLSVAQLLKDQMRWADQIGRYDKTTFLLVLPETGGQDALMLIQKIKKAIDLLNQTSKKKVIARFGLSEWTKGDDLQRLLARSKENIQ